MRRLRRFRDEREWGNLHTLKDLAAAISIEASELQEIFLWRSESQVKTVQDERVDEIRDELADILILCLNFADVAQIDVLDAIEEKIERNDARYPVEKSRGSPEKYTNLE
jgi:NTP pyrophosphatase (non-canonical NTP hydrolase)